MIEENVLQHHSLTTQVLEKLIQCIRSGVYLPQTQLPPENALAAEFAVSRSTIRTAMEFLAAQHLVIRRQGVGTFVSALAQIRDPLDQAVLFQTMIENNGYKPGVKFLPPLLVEPTARQREALRAVAADRLLAMPKIFTADGDPVIYCTNTFPPGIMSETLLAAALAAPTATEPIFESLEKRCAALIIFYVAFLGPTIVKNIQLPDNAYAQEALVLTIDEIAYDTNKRPVMHSVHHYPGNRIDFELVRRRQVGAPTN